MGVEEEDVRWCSSWQVATYTRVGLKDHAQQSKYRIDKYSMHPHSPRIGADKPAISICTAVSGWRGPKMEWNHHHVVPMTLLNPTANIAADI